MFFYVSINKNGTQGAGLKGPVWRLYNSNILKTWSMTKNICVTLDFLSWSQICLHKLKSVPDLWAKTLGRQENYNEKSGCTTIFIGKPFPAFCVYHVIILKNILENL